VVIVDITRIAAGIVANEFDVPSLMVLGNRVVRSRLELTALSIEDAFAGCDRDNWFLASELAYSEIVLLRLERVWDDCQYQRVSFPQNSVVEGDTGFEGGMGVNQENVMGFFEGRIVPDYEDFVEDVVSQVCSFFHHRILEAMTDGQHARGDDECYAAACQVVEDALVRLRAPSVADVLAAAGVDSPGVVG
jgi:hypothetical protein